MYGSPRRKGPFQVLSAVSHSSVEMCWAVSIRTEISNGEQVFVAIKDKWEKWPFSYAATTLPIAKGKDGLKTELIIPVLHLFFVLTLVIDE